MQPPTHYREKVILELVNTKATNWNQLPPVAESKEVTNTNCSDEAEISTA